MSSVRPKVIVKIQSDLSNRFRVVDNTGEDKKVIGSQIPDVLIFRKDSTDNSETPLFIMKVENGGDLADSLASWKDLGKVPSTFYIVTSKEKLDEAKKLAGATEINARFAWYENKVGEIIVHYE